MTDPRRLAVAFRTFGCKVNRVESEDAAADLLGRGVRVVAEEEAAVVVVNTCTVTAEADRKARKAVRHALGLAQAPVVVVSGCLAALDTGELAALGERVVVEPDRERVAGRVADLLGVEAPPPAERVRAGEGFRTRAAVKVADGCDAFCAYCIVPYARGVPRSVPLAEVVAEVERLEAAGVAEVVLTGINIGRYADPGASAGDAGDAGAVAGAGDLAALVRAVAATGIARIRISSIEPLDVTPALLEALAETPAACPHLHVPLQSGSDAVLAAMGRGYTRAGFAARVEAARAALPGLAVTTDVMTAFPGETDADAAATLAAVEELGFARLHVFRYSPRSGTRAAGMAGRVDPGAGASRAAALRELDAVLRERHAAGRLGEEAEVLVEHVDERGARGTSEDYLTVRVAADEGRAWRVGEVVRVRLTGREGEGLLGEALRAT